MTVLGLFSGLSLKRAIVIAMLLGVLLPVLVSGPLLLAEKYNEDIDRRVNDLLSQYGQMLAEAMVQPLWQANAVAAKPFVDAVMLNPDVISVTVEDESLGHFVVSQRPAPHAGELLNRTVPVAMEQRVIGKVTVQMTTAFVEQQFLLDLAKSSGALLLQVVVSFVFLWTLFERRLIRPLNHLRTEVRRLSEGQLEQPVTVQTRDEMHELAEGIDQMRASLRDKMDEVNALNGTLEQRVAERTQALNDANRNLQDAVMQLRNAQDEIQRSERMAALGALVAGVAHELNTPIGNSVTVASTLHDLSADFAKEMQMGLTRSALSTYAENVRKASDMLQRNLNNAATLIGSFKQVAVDRTTAQRRPFRLNEVVAETVLTMGPVLKRRRHKVHEAVPEGIIMASYPGQLGQILSNLIANAVLHGFDEREGGRIEITARRLDEERVELSVADDGEGIAEANLRRIFDPFFTTRMGRGGTGLGLNIVHNLVEDVLGGSIHVESQVGKGTRFVLNLPCEAPHSDARSV